MVSLRKLKSLPLSPGQLNFFCLSCNPYTHPRTFPEPGVIKSTVVQVRPSYFTSACVSDLNTAVTEMLGSLLSVVRGEMAVSRKASKAGAWGWGMMNLRAHAARDPHSTTGQGWACFVTSCFLGGSSSGSESLLLSPGHLSWTLWSEPQDTGAPGSDHLPIHQVDGHSQHNPCL